MTLAFSRFDASRAPAKVNLLNTIDNIDVDLLVESERRSPLMLIFFFCSVGMFGFGQTAIAT